MNSGVCFINQGDVELDADKAEGKFMPDVELVNQGTSPAPFCLAIT